MGHSIRIACAAMVVAFTVGLGATAASGTVVADQSPAQHGVTHHGFDWDGARLATPAQS
ncbi:hypothetical protein FHX73_114580 [Kitasatospora viridis]|uniref:Uncharacterized protein n=1 Tax=Kitasatospora viridis TaxID=281105 RepID=A0A561UMW5_9ACTN|nr:hypothetical protein FHX73_114580 [Kitasatospora viridis]